MKRVVVLGSTGSIGKQTICVLEKNPDMFTLVGVSCEKNIVLLKEQMQKHNVKFACCKNYPNEKENIFSDELTLVKHLEFDVLVAGSGGIDSLDAVLFALDNNKRVCIANKELLVCAGSLIMSKNKANVIPVDSEHSAIFQCLENRGDIKDVTLTCSGGALRNVPIADLWNTDVAKVLAHPTWKMGKKITIDCATMANKAFEVMEAKHLFGLRRNQINVLIHPESIVHGMVTFYDGSTIAHLAQTTMEIPITYALSYPKRLYTDNTLDLVGKSLSFFEPDLNRYPLFGLLTERIEDDSFCAKAAGADEAAVKMFLQGIINYSELHTIIEQVLSNVENIVINNPEIAKELYYQGYRKVLEKRNIK